MNGITYSSNGTYYQQVSDTLFNINLTIKNLKFSSQSFSLCVGESITVGNNIYNSDGNYSEDEVKQFLNNMGQPNAQLIVGHSPKRDDGWHWQILDNHHIIFAGHNRVGYAVIQNKNVNFIEVAKGLPKPELADKAAAKERNLQQKMTEEIDLREKKHLEIDYSKY